MKMSKGFARVYLSLCFPIIIQNLITYGIDSVCVAILGTLSDKAISGYTIANESFSIYSMVSLGLCGGFHAFISQLYGDNNKAKYNQVFRIGFKLLAVVGVLYSLGMCVFAKPFINMYITDAEMVQYGVDYLRIYSWSHLFYGVNLLISGVYMFIGEAKVAMYGAMINCVATLLSTYLLVYGIGPIPSLGVSGAAIAILIGRIVEFVLLFTVINRADSPFNFREKYPKMDTSEIIGVFKTSLPLMLNEVMYSIAMMFVVKNLSHISESDIACYTVVNNCNKVFFVVCQSLSPAVGALVAKNLGIGEFDKAKKAGNDILLFMLYVHVVFGVILYALAGVIPGFFSLEGEIGKLCANMIRIKAIFALFGGYTNCFYVILKMGGDTLHVLCMDGIFTLACPMLLTFLCAYVFNISFFWSWVIQDACLIVKTLIGFVFYLKGNWVKKLS